MRKILLLFLAVVVHSTTVFAFNGYEKYIEKFNSKVDKSEIYNIGESILNASRSYDFNPILILAIMKTESHFDRLAYNSLDARGLMQIRLPVWFDLLKKEGFVRTWRDFYNAERNTYSGVYILSIYRKKCKEDLRCFLQRYNGDRKGIRYYAKVMKAMIQYDKIYKQPILKLKYFKNINISEDKNWGRNGIRLGMIVILNASKGELAFSKAQM